MTWEALAATQAAERLSYHEIQTDSAGRLIPWCSPSPGIACDSKNRYPNDDIWLTDGYGDYVRHYLRE